MRSIVVTPALQEQLPDTDCEIEFVDSDGTLIWRGMWYPVPAIRKPSAGPEIVIDPPIDPPAAG